MFKTIDEALDWIVLQRRNDAAFSHFQKVMEMLENPQEKLKIIHVTGTNGKGSTITFLRDLLVEHGFKVGTLQSPHYLTHLDRIRINGQNIEGGRFLTLLNKRLSFFKEHHLNMFEMDYIIMCDYFIEEKVDYALVEVGIGGRLDSTNVIQDPLMSIIVSIGYDHTDRLGNTLEEITIEKCGIIKEGHPVLIGKIAPSLEDIIKENAYLKKSPLIKVKDYIDLKNQRFIYRGETYSLLSFGHYQKHNAALAIEAFLKLAEMEGFDKDSQKMKKAIETSLWKGRFEMIQKKPFVFVDGAHNVAGIEALCESLDALEGKKAILFSALKTKDYLTMIQLLKKHCQKIVLTHFDHPLMMSFDDLSDYEIESDFYEAYLKLCKEYDCIVICGSLYFVSAFMERFKNNHA